MATHCPGCGMAVEPVRAFERDPATRKWWRVSKCPRERCGFNIDLDECDNPGRNAGPGTGDRRRNVWQDGG